MADVQATAVGTGGRADRAGSDALPALRVDDLGMGMARLAVSQCLPLDVARRIAAILREGGLSSDSSRIGRGLATTGAQGPIDRGRRKAVRDRGRMSGS